MAEAPDGSLLVWISGTAVALITAAFGHVHKRMNRMDDAQNAARTAEADKLWKAVNSERNASRDFREKILEKMVTQQDLRDFERRLLAALAPHRLTRAEPDDDG